jgi:pentatricopeptide repeat protein
VLPRYAVVRYGWSSILDAMVGASLTMGNRGRAEQYHQELLEMGAAPSANTFGLYITTLKESTKTFDEASEAVRIFQRAVAEGVEPSSFLYNALIGKLGKARRIDDCLFYFSEMRALGIKPTSVTYGTVVNALCRVSDVKFAEELFDEMEAMRNYKARPAPYNSMMQFFLTTKRDKSKVLAYYERMKAKGIAPTSHTYKLLVDTYATLEPVDMAAAENVLDTLRRSGERPEPVHYASLIHARGCVLHDMEGARRVFDDIVREKLVPLNASIFQALFEAMVANHCVADTESILEQMRSRRIEITPYIANTLIHGWAAEKNIDKAQRIYDTLGRDKREPSTYEAMTRAFLAVELRDQAKGVVGEMLTRGYPSAVVNKVLELLGGGHEAPAA